MDKDGLKSMKREERKEETGRLHTIRVCNGRVDLADRFTVLPGITLGGLAETFGILVDSLVPAFRVCFLNRRTGEMTFDGSLTVKEFCPDEQDMLSVCVYYTG